MIYPVLEVQGLVNRFGIPTNVALLTNVVTSMLLNFVCRKFFVYKS